MMGTAMGISRWRGIGLSLRLGRSSLDRHRQNLALVNSGMRYSWRAPLRRRRNRAGLDVVVAEYLPAIPQDRITGEAVKYRIVEGRPIVYSVGVDRDDDGGKMPTNRGEVERYYAAEWNSSSKVDGDWVLYSTAG